MERRKRGDDGRREIEEKLKHKEEEEERTKISNGCRAKEAEEEAKRENRTRKRIEKKIRTERGRENEMMEGGRPTVKPRTRKKRR